MLSKLAIKFYTIILILFVARSNVSSQFQDLSNGRKMVMTDVCHMHGNGLQCDDKGVLLKLGHCLTYNETENTATLGFCTHFDIRRFNVTIMSVDNLSSTFVRLANNINQSSMTSCVGGSTEKASFV